MICKHCETRISKALPVLGLFLEGIWKDLRKGSAYCQGTWKRHEPLYISLEEAIVGLQKIVADLS